MVETIGNPLSWTAKELALAGGHIARAEEALHGSAPAGTVPRVRRLDSADLIVALRRGWADFAATRSDVLVLVALYPLIGAVLFWLAAHASLIHLFLPVLSGFALVGPVAAVGLYELSRRRERGERAILWDALAIRRAPAFGAVVALGAMLLGLFVVWIAVATMIYQQTVGVVLPLTLGAVLVDLATTAAGLEALAIGTVVGCGFAAAVLVTSMVSFPLLLDRDVGLPRAVATSLRVARRNPGPVALWGGIVAVGLALGALPALVGLVVVVPVLGHATWHLYRAAVAWD